LNEKIQQLVDTQEICQLVARYARAADWLDIAGMKACFAKDAIVSFGTHGIPSDAFCDFWSGVGSGFKARHHLLGTPLVSFTGNDSAYVEVPAIVAGTRAEKGARLRDFMECNRYIVDAVRGSGGWQFAAMRVFITWSQGAPTSTGMESGGPLDHDIDVNHRNFVALRQ
jgi:SnoaL-like domain